MEPVGVRPPGGGHNTRPARRARRPAGFTLVELLLGFVVLALIGVMVTAITLTGVLSSSGETSEREFDAAAADVVAITFGRDVQGASSLAATHCGAEGDPLVTFVASADPARTVSYRSAVDGEGHTLVRQSCTAGEVQLTTVLQDGLDVAPTVACAPGACTTGFPPPRSVTLRTGRRAEFAFDTEATRRTGSVAAPPPALTARLFATGGSAPLSVSGNGHLVVDGDAYVNSTSAAAVAMGGGNARLSVTGAFRILDGGGCSGCNAARVTPFPPGSFPAPLPDPLAYLPTPSEDDASMGSCTTTRCTPGIYANRLDISGDKVLEPGVYLLRRGLGITGQGTVRGEGVVLFNGCGVGAPSGCAGNQGAVTFGGQATVLLSPPTSGTYRGILLFQSRANAATVSVAGQAVPSFFDGVMYAPAGAVALGGGNGDLRLGAVVGRNLSVSGNGTVTVDG